MNGRVTGETTEAREKARRAPKGGTVTMTREAKGKARSRAKAETLASLEAPDDEGEWCWPGGTRTPGGVEGLIHDQHSATSHRR